MKANFDHEKLDVYRESITFVIWVEDSIKHHTKKTEPVDYD